MKNTYSIFVTFLLLLILGANAEAKDGSARDSRTSKKKKIVFIDLAPTSEGKKRISKKSPSKAKRQVVEVGFNGHAAPVEIEPLSRAQQAEIQKEEELMRQKRLDAYKAKKANEEKILAANLAAEKKLKEEQISNPNNAQNPKTQASISESKLKTLMKEFKKDYQDDDLEEELEN